MLSPQKRSFSNVKLFDFQIVSHYRIEKHRVARTIAERKTWKKYGLSKNDKPGPNPATTITAEDVFMHVCYQLSYVGMCVGIRKAILFSCLFFIIDAWRCQVSFMASPFLEEKYIIFLMFYQMWCQSFLCDILKIIIFDSS